MSCAGGSGSGGNGSIPTVVVNCTSTSCRQNMSGVAVTVLFTTLDCASLNIRYAAASSALQLNCTVTGGCYGSTSSWVDSQGKALTALPCGSYTVCGRIDPLNTPDLYTDDITASLSGVSISTAASGPLTLTNWAGP